MELFGELTLGEEDWDDEYFVSWREAYRSETIYRRRVFYELKVGPKVVNIEDKTWRQIFREESRCKEPCAREFPNAVKESWDSWCFVYFYLKRNTFMMREMNVEDGR